MQTLTQNNGDKFEKEQRIYACEAELNIILAEIKVRKKSIADLKAFLERTVKETPEAVPLMCGMISAAINSDFIPFEYLQAQIINSYNLRIANGDNEAHTQKYYYQISSGLIADPTARPLIKTSGEA